MKLLQKIKHHFTSRVHQTYSLNDTFGCPESPPQKCPTFLERDVHRRFRSAIYAHNIIVVYGESRQGKTWTIDRYCPERFRIGCTAAMDVEQIKKEMLHAVGVDVRLVEHSITQQSIRGAKATTEVGFDMLGKAGFDAESTESHEETLKTAYSTIDFSIDADFLDVLSQKSQNGYFVFDNFHYLSVSTQQQFCSLLKEFNYRNIKVIIVGVWKDSSRITALAPDLVDRCEHIDIGSWSDDELKEVVKNGEKALNIKIDPSIVDLFIRCSSHNIGIFKTYLRKLCDNIGVSETRSKHMFISDESATARTIEEVVNEAFIPLRDRIRNLSTPKREKSTGKRMRQKIVCAIINLIVANEPDYAQKGIPFQTLFDEVCNICKTLGEDLFGRSNVTQELMQLHLREENKNAPENFIPLFFYDTANQKLLVIDPGFYQIKAFNQELLTSISEELMGTQMEQMVFETV